MLQRHDCMNKVTPHTNRHVICCFVVLCLGGHLIRFQAPGFEWSSCPSTSSWDMGLGHHIELIIRFQLKLSDFLWHLLCGWMWRHVLINMKTKGQNGKWCNPSAWEPEAGAAWVWGQLGLYKLKTYLDYTTRNCNKKQQTNTSRLEIWLHW